MPSSKRGDIPSFEDRPSKRMKRSDTPLEELTDGGLLSQDDVVYYQKEAIYRLLNTIRHRNQRLRKEVKKMNGKYTILSKYYHIINNWWSEIIDNFKNFDLITKIENEDGSEFNQHLLISVPEMNDRTSGETKALTEELKGKREKLIALLQPILSLPVTNRDDKLVELEDSFTNLNAFKSNLEGENKMLKEKIEDLNQELDKYIKKVDVRKSKSLDRISDNLHDREELKEEEEGKKGNMNSSSSVDGNIEGESSLKEAQAVKYELEDLKVAFSSLKNEHKNVKEQLQKELTNISVLQKEISGLRSGLSNLSEDDLKGSPAYQSVITRNSELTAQLNQVKFNSSKIESQLYDMESNLTAHKKQLEDDAKSQIAANAAYITKLESDINRIRADRDKHRSENNILKAEKGKTELCDEYRQLNESLQKRLDELIVASKIEMDPEDGSVDDIKEETPDKISLIRKNKLLIKELKQMEEAFTSIRKSFATKLSKYVESDAYINKLSVEKSRADEKYFQAMRAKDALTAQNKILKGSITKQADLIDVLKSNEKRLIEKLDVEKSLYSKLKEVESLYTNDLTYQKNASREAEIKLSSTKKEFDSLKTELFGKQEALGEKDKVISSLNSKNESNESKVHELEKLIAKYRSNSRSAEDDAIDQALLTMTKCQLCNKNFKNVTLKSCGHCFCSECIHNRLASRMRKCPSCNKQFSNYDLLSIHL